MTRPVRLRTKWVLTFTCFVYVLVFILVCIHVDTTKFQTLVQDLDTQLPHTHLATNVHIYAANDQSQNSRTEQGENYKYARKFLNISRRNLTRTSNVNSTVVQQPHVQRIVPFEAVLDNNRLSHKNVSSNESSPQGKHRIRKHKADILSTTMNPSIGLHSHTITQRSSKLHELQVWRKYKDVCDSNVRINYDKIITFTNITLYPSASNSPTKTVELTDVLNQSERHEYLDLKPGFFATKCNVSDFQKNLKIPSPANHYASWLSSFNLYKPNERLNSSLYITVYTIAMVRNEYANVYWNIVDLYNVYITCLVNNKSISRTSILIMDAHPRGLLDKLWTNTFHSVIRPSDLQETTTYQKLSWLFPRDESPILGKTTHAPPVWLPFRNDILAVNQIADDHSKNCTVVIPSTDKVLHSTSKAGPTLKILLIWRRDYVAHPRNPSGLVMRKIKNEAQIERVLKQAFPTFSIRGVQLDTLSIKEQLYLISHSDILIGMHGAAMSLTVFMPPHSAVIELYPKYYSNYNWHMEYIAKWTGHSYYTWKNNDDSLEDKKKGYSVIPLDVIIKLVNKASNNLCRSI